MRKRIRYARGARYARNLQLRRQQLCALTRHLTSGNNSGKP